MLAGSRNKFESRASRCEGHEVNHNPIELCERPAEVATADSNTLLFFRNVSTRQLCHFGVILSRETTLINLFDAFSTPECFFNKQGRLGYHDLSRFVVIFGTSDLRENVIRHFSWNFRYLKKLSLNLLTKIPCFRDT